jgi:hydrogenase expression/formation protein HypC
MCLAIPGRVVRIAAADTAFRLGTVDFGGIIKSISLSFTPDARPGDYVLVHVGFALTVISEDEAQKTLAFLKDVEPADASGTS